MEKENQTIREVLEELNNANEIDKLIKILFEDDTLDEDEKLTDEELEIFYAMDDKEKHCLRQYLSIAHTARVKKYIGKTELYNKIYGVLQNFELDSLEQACKEIVIRIGMKHAMFLKMLREANPEMEKIIEQMMTENLAYHNILQYTDFIQSIRLAYASYLKDLVDNQIEKENNENNDDNKNNENNENNENNIE